MKKYIAVIGYRYRSFIEWKLDNPVQDGCEYLFIDSVDKSRGRTFAGVKFLHDAYLLNNYSNIKNICLQRVI